MVINFKTNTEVIGTGNEWKSKVNVSEIKPDYQREMPGPFNSLLPLVSGFSLLFKAVNKVE